MRICFGVFLMVIFFGSPATAFMPADTGQRVGSCKDCHILSKEEAQEVFKGLQGEVASVDFAKVPGLWQIEMKVKDKTVLLYLDFTKSYLISGSIIRLKDRKNLTLEHYRQLNAVDLSRIPTNDALLLGNPKAEKKIIVFTDPLCSYCRKLHSVLQQAVAKRSDLLFLIKLMPIKQGSDRISKTIVCNKSMEQLEAAFAGESIPDTNCDTKAIEESLAIASSNDINRTPTLVLPNGQIAVGYKPLEALLDLIDQNLPTQNSLKNP